MSAYRRNKTPEQAVRDRLDWQYRCLDLVLANDRANGHAPASRAPAYINPFQLYMARHRLNIVRHPTWFPRQYKAYAAEIQAQQAQSTETV